MHVVEYHTLDAIELLREAWNALLPQTPDASFCLSPDWLAVHYRHSAAERQPLILAVVEAGEVVGVLPLAIQRQRRKLGELRVLTLAGDTWVSFLGPVGRDPDGVLAACCDHLRRRTRNYDLLDLTGLRCRANDSRLPLAPARSVALIDLADDWDAYWESRKAASSRSRNIVRCERRLAEQGRIEYVRHRPAGSAHGDDDPRWDLFDACASVAQQSWQSGVSDGNTLSHESVQHFLREAHQMAAARGALDVNVLRLDGRPLAFVYGYHHRGYLDLIRAGFHPEFAKLAPGNALWTRLIRDSFERGDRVLDLGPSYLDYKQIWLTRVETQQSLRYYPPTAWGQALRLGHWLRRQLPAPNESNRRSKQLVTAAQDGLVSGVVNGERTDRPVQRD
jgi:CelD/BcsL family acetyltransferase involved in cellulose biosynthesis